jgi:hypothetical protein
VLKGEKDVLNYDLIFVAPVTKNPPLPRGRKTDPAIRIVGEYRRGLTGGPEVSANNKPEPAYASNTYVPRNEPGLHGNYKLS